MDSFHYTCPYCDRDCIVGVSDVKKLTDRDWISSEYGTYQGTITIVTCPNKTCRKQLFHAKIVSLSPNTQNKLVVEKVLYQMQLLPESEAKNFPDYIPGQLRNDYAEACLIKSKSPKASATLSRRCLQGMIRDFWEIRKTRLIDEIEELKGKVDSTTWQAIDAVRQVGNIGAHMEKDVNLIIDVGEKEAGLLIGLIETLFREWYVAKHEREVRMSAITQLAKSKKNKGTTNQKF